MTSDDLEEQKEAARALMEEFDQNGVGTYLYQPAAIYGYKNNIEWNTYFVKNHVTPFRAGDITIK